MALLSIFVNNILPVLLIAGAGFWVGKKHHINPQNFGSVVFHVFAPALVFSSLVHSNVPGPELISLFVATLLGQIALGLIVYILIRVFRPNRIDSTSVILSTMCLNAGNFGLSLTFFAFDSIVFESAIAIFVANMILNYTIGVFVASNGRSSLLESAVNIFKVPAVYASILAILFRLTGIEVPLAIVRAMTVMGDAAIPGMLIMLGMQIVHFQRIPNKPLLTVGVITKLLIAPFLGLLILNIIPMSLPSQIAFLMQISMPTAVLTIVLATEYELEIDMVVSMIGVTTLLSPIPLSILIYILQNSYALN